MARTPSSIAVEVYFNVRSFLKYWCVAALASRARRRADTICRPQSAAAKRLRPRDRVEEAFRPSNSEGVSSTFFPPKSYKLSACREGIVTSEGADACRHKAASRRQTYKSTSGNGHSSSGNACHTDFHACCSFKTPTTTDSHPAKRWELLRYGG